MGKGLVEGPYTVSFSDEDQTHPLHIQRRAFNQ